MKFSAPGKLMISGEWSVLEGNTCVVAAVDRRVFVEISKSDEISVSVKDFGIKDVKADFDGSELEWKNANAQQQERLAFAKAAIEASLQYIGKYKPFKINSWNEDTQIKVGKEKKKIGFGSSAASVVAMVAAILAFHGIDIKKNKEVIYKLSAIAHYFAQGKVGSAFDVAASTYGNVIAYNRFDAAWLLSQFESKKSVNEIIGQQWPDFKVEALGVPKNLVFLVAWTNASASTSAMIKQMGGFKQANPGAYSMIYDSIGKLAVELVDAWKKEDRKRIIELVRANEALLSRLGAESGVNIETPELKKLSEIADMNSAAGKLSGAGGGDCGIAICFDKRTAEKIRLEWKKSGLYPLDVSIDKDGIRTEK